MLKEQIDAGLDALKGFSEVINTKDKAIILVMTCNFITLNVIATRVFTIDGIERIFIAPHCEQLVNIKPPAKL